MSAEGLPLVHAGHVTESKAPEIWKQLKSCQLKGCDLVVVDVRHLMVSQGGSRLVVDLKTSIELQSLQQLFEEMSLWFSFG